MDNLLSGFITSQLRIKILTRLFLNTDTHSYLRELVTELKASPSQVKSELDYPSFSASVKMRRGLGFALAASLIIFATIAAYVKPVVKAETKLSKIT